MNMCSWWTRSRWQVIWRTWGLLGIAVIGTSCISISLPSATDRTQAIRPNTEKELEAFTRLARDPREFAITITLDENQTPRVVNAHRVRPDLVALVPLAGPEYSTLAILEGQIGPRPVRFLLDPTSAGNWTSLERARKYGMVPLGPPLIYAQPDHVPELGRGALCVCPELQVDVMTVAAALFYARPIRGPLWPLARSADAHDVDAVLGWVFLRAFEYVSWEFSIRAVVFSSRPLQLEPDHPRVLDRLPLLPGYNALAVNASVDGKIRPVLVDLAGDFEFVQEEPSLSPLRQVSLGEVVFRNVRVSSRTEQGLGFPNLSRIGLRLLSRFDVVLDNHRNELWILAPRVRP